MPFVGTAALDCPSERPLPTHIPTIWPDTNALNRTERDDQRHAFSRKSLFCCDFSYAFGLFRIFRWCPGEDSNLHVVRHTDLNRARLPIPPPGQSGCEGGVIGPLGRNVNGEIQQPNTQQPSVVRTNPALRTIRTMPPKSRRSRQSLLSAPSEHSDAAVAFRERCFQSCELGIAVQFCYPTFGPRSLLQLQCWSEQREIGITTVV
jgi:hypothetical protein